MTISSCSLTPSGATPGALRRGSQIGRNAIMVSFGLKRRQFVEALVASSFGGVALSAQTPGPPVMKVPDGSGRVNDIITLPGGDRIHVKVSTHDSAGALFTTDQSTGSRTRL